MVSKKVCVVGAGVSGLASARELRREGHDVTVMEQSGDVGGQWLYDPATDVADPLGTAGVHSSIYASLRLIIPREDMSFSDFPFYPKNGGDARRFPGHGEFLRYIRDFCAAFGLMDAIRLNTKVVHVGMAPRDGGAVDDGCLRWVVRSMQRGEDEAEVITEEVFDAVVVAVGQYAQPRLPTINGMDKWRRRQMHSHSYRVPDSFQDEVVVVVGCHESGKDIALELRKVAREVHLSVKSMDDVTPGLSKALARHPNLHLHLQIDRLCEDGQVMFADGSCVAADSVIYCTGYNFSFPFLDTGGLVTVDDNRVGPLFEHTFPPALAPSLSFVGVPKKVFVPLFYEVQARWVAQVLSGRRELPSPEEMLQSVHEYNRAREMAGVPKRLSHDIFIDFEYCDAFGEKYCGFPRLEEWKKELLWSSLSNMRDNLETFRDNYHDCDLVQEGLRSQGWLPRVAQEEEESVGGEMVSKKVCVVGAGVSGLVSARELRREGHEVTVMEQSSGVGGQWLYEPATGGGDPLGAAGVHSSVYASLRLVIPREDMGFSDFPFYPKDGGDARRFPEHGEFLRYIRDFCDAFGLMDAVRLNTKVVHVGMAPRDGGVVDGGCLRWVVRSLQRGEDEGSKVVTEEVFDAVVVAVGQYAKPRLPAINGMDKWRRRHLHSYSYRVPDSFKNEVVVVVGCHKSGKDIALELRKVAREVHLSAKSMDDVTPGMSKALARHPNLHLHLQIDRLCEDGQVMFVDGSCVAADSVVYCTGYDYSFPFLDTGGLVTVDDNLVGPLFEHTFPPDLAPSLSFVGVPKKVLVQFYEVQARWVAQVLSGRRGLPSPEEMLRCVEEYNHAKEMAGVPKRLSHDISGDFEYCDAFGEKHCGFPRLEEWKKKLLWSSFNNMRDNLESFRDEYHDCDLVREGLRSQGWLPRVMQDEEEDSVGH
ncbi:hypothetical protein ACP70R_014653 [Stipagrostis hirtigluma subsp. patula]